MVKTIPVADPALLPLSSMPETSDYQRHIEASFYHTSVCVWVPKEEDAMKKAMERKEQLCEEQTSRHKSEVT